MRTLLRTQKYVSYKKLMIMVDETALIRYKWSKWSLLTKFTENAHVTYDKKAHGCTFQIE